MDNKGKKFEQKFKEDWNKTVQDSSIDRLFDGTSGFKNISNISDFIAYAYPNIYYIECKTTQDVSFPIKHLTQYEKLTQKIGIKGVVVGVLIWYYNYDHVVFIPITTVKEIKETGVKSININKLLVSDYEYIEIPSVKKRTFMDSDYSKLVEYYRNKEK